MTASYLGLVPGEHSSGERHRRGPIRTGNTLARRLVVEAAWHYRHRPGVSRTLAQRRSGQPPRVIALADKAQQRLCRRFRRLAEHKPGPVVTVAVARELVDFCGRPAPGGGMNRGAVLRRTPSGVARGLGRRNHRGGRRVKSFASLHPTPTTVGTPKQAARNCRKREVA